MFGSEEACEEPTQRAIFPGAIFSSRSTGNLRPSSECHQAEDTKCKSLELQR